MGDSSVIALNFIVCMGAVDACACRLWKLDARSTRLDVVATYVVCLPVLVASSISWTFGVFPSAPQIAMNLVVLAVLLIGYIDWRRGPPAYAMKAASRGIDQ